MNHSLLKLSETDLRTIAAALRAGRLVLPLTSASLQRFVGSARSVELAAELESLTTTGFTAINLATMLELIAADRDHRPAVDDIVDLVTTGPEARGVTNRDTAVVVRELFASAKSSVLVAGFAVYQGQRVFEALADRMLAEPNLKVRLFLDIQRPNGDTTAAGELVRRFADRFRQRQWPQDRPLPEVYFDPRSVELPSDKRACLHAKCIVVDQQFVFVSSANFTEAAQERNIEVGLTIHSHAVATQLSHFFEAMLAENLLKPVW